MPASEERKAARRDAKRRQRMREKAKEALEPTPVIAAVQRVGRKIETGTLPAQVKKRQADMKYYRRKKGKNAGPVIQISNNLHLPL